MERIFLEGNGFLSFPQRLSVPGQPFPGFKAGASLFGGLGLNLKIFKFKNSTFPALGSSSPPHPRAWHQNKADKTLSKLIKPYQTLSNSQGWARRDPEPPPGLKFSLLALNYPGIGWDEPSSVWGAQIPAPQKNPGTARVLPFLGSFLHLFGLEFDLFGLEFYLPWAPLLPFWAGVLAFIGPKFNFFFFFSRV